MPVVDSQLLKTALLVARAGSFAAAARQAQVDPSSVSRQVATLEQHLGVRLFERTTRRLQLTEAGRLYLARVAPALDLLDEAWDAARDAWSEPSGLLRITASVAFAERWLVPRIATFRAAHPRIQLQLELSDAQMDLAAEGLDLAIRLGPRPSTGAWVVTRLWPTVYKVVAAPRYLNQAGWPRSPSELAQHVGLLFCLPTFRLAWRFRHLRSGQKTQAIPADSLSMSNALALRRAALEGLGVALLAEWTVGEDLASGRLIELFPDYEVSVGEGDSAAWLLYPSRDYMPMRLRVFIDHLKSDATKVKVAKREGPAYNKD